MAKYGSKDVGFFLVGGYNLLGYATEIAAGDPESITEPSATIGDTWHEVTPVGVKRCYLSQNGFYDDESGGINAATAELQNVSRVVSLAHEGNTIGKRFLGWAGAFSAKYSRIISLGKLHKANVAYTTTGEHEQGVILQDYEAVTADGNTDAESVDNAALTSNGGAGYLQVGPYTGFTGYVAKIRHSDDDSTYADLVTFTNVTAARQAERVTCSGTVNRHLLVAHDVTGTGSATVFVGFARG
jgi:hypothetical protein